MSEQTLDLRGSGQILRRHKALLFIVTILGILAGGVAYVELNPPMFASTALVALAQTTDAQQGAVVADGGGPDPYTATQEVIATSNIVLSGALPDVPSVMSIDELRRDIQTASPTAYIISISAKAKVAADAETMANAVARSYISYVNSANSPISGVSAKLFEPAASGMGSRLKPLLIDAFCGAAVGLLIGVLIALAIGRNDRRLRERDQIADSIGVPVLASVSVSRPSDAADWMKLLAEYEPSAVEAWQLRKALRQLGVVGTNSADPQVGSGFSLGVISLSSDRKALALGPQLAAFAASLGIPTALVIGPQQDAEAAATLRAACAAPTPLMRSRYLRVAVNDQEYVGQLSGAVLTVIVAVVDGKDPRVAHTMRPTAALLGVSACTTTAQQLARVAASAAINSREIIGILVADPDPADRTTGRMPQVARPGQRRMPTRMTGITTGIRR